MKVLRVLNKYISSAYKIIPLIGVLLILTLSCAKDITPEVVIDEDAWVQLTIHTPQPSVVTKTQTAEECKITDVQVIVFESGLYKYHVEGSIVSSTTTKTTFNALLRSSPSAVKLYIIANAKTAVVNNLPAVGSGESVIKNVLQMAYTPGITENFPMHGEYNLPSGIDATQNNTIGDIKMLRAIAKADVLLDDNVKNFKLLTVQTFRANNSFKIIPDNVADIDNPVVTSPSIPASSTTSINTPKINVPSNILLSKLYLPESKAPDESKQTSEATCIVIGGFYDNSTDTTYYRIDFDSGEQGHPFGQILRNHRYIFSIVGVNMAGWETPEEAANNVAAGISVDIENWNEDINYIEIGNNYFGISHRDIVVEYKTGSQEYVSIETNVTDVKLQWCNEDGDVDIGIPPASTISNSLFKVEVSADGSQIIVTALTTNTSGDRYHDYVMICADNINVKISISQLDRSDRSIAFVNILAIGTGEGGFTSTSAAAMNSIVNNATNFGTNGIVTLGGMKVTTFQNTDFTALRAQLEMYDIIFLSADANPNATMAEAIVEWLDYRENRVLFINRTSTTSNSNLINELGNQSMWGAIGTQFQAKFVGSNATHEYFTKTGPFGELSNHNKDSFEHTTKWTNTCINSSHALAQNITPILYYVHNSINYYVLSVDMTSRIVYIGSPYIWENNNGLTNNGLTNYDAAKVTANLWAWAIEEIVIPGKVK